MGKERQRGFVVHLLWCCFCVDHYCSTHNKNRQLVVTSTMAANRKLVIEIERMLKKCNEGLDVLDGLWYAIKLPCISRENLCIEYLSLSLSLSLDQPRQDSPKLTCIINCLLFVSSFFLYDIIIIILFHMSRHVLSRHVMTYDDDGNGHYFCIDDRLVCHDEG